MVVALCVIILKHCCYLAIAYYDRVWRRPKRVVLEAVIRIGRKVDLVVFQRGNFYLFVVRKIRVRPIRVYGRCPMFRFFRQKKSDVRFRCRCSACTTASAAVAQ